MSAFIAAIVFTLGVSAFCSVMEAMILSTTTAEIEDLKKKRPRRGKCLEESKTNIESTISSILTLNTIANTLGATLVGGLATRLFGHAWLGVVSGALTFGILIFSEIIPKNFGVAHRILLQDHMAYPLAWLRSALKPVTYFCDLIVKLIIRDPRPANIANREIILLAEKGAEEGHLTRSELSMVANALSLDDVRVSEIMTPRTVVTAIDEALTVGEVFRKYRMIPFARMPVYRDTIDEITGLVRRRDLLHAIAEGDEETRIVDLKQEIHFVPETITGAAALQMFLRNHQQLAVVVDEFGSVTGVVTMEDIMEYIIGREIFEKDDLAIDMRELARTRNLLEKKRTQMKQGEAS